MQNPCYDSKTKTDCPDRHQGCASTCSKWSEYVSEREKEYERRKRMAEANGAAIDLVNARVTFKCKKTLRDRRYKRSRRTD